MRVLQINASYKPAYIYGGPTMSVSKLCEQLIIAGQEVVVFTTTANGEAELPESSQSFMMVDNVPVYYYRRLTKGHTHFSPQLLKAVWQQARQFDVVHIHAWWNLVSVLAGLITLMRGVPLVISPRGTLSAYSFRNKNAFIKKIIHAFLGKPVLSRSAIHTTSTHEQMAISQLIKPRRIITIPNFVNIPPRREIIASSPTGLLKLIFFSRIEEKKGLDLLINALKNVAIPYHLTIAGDGDPDYITNLKELAAQNNAAKHISWIGFLNDMQKFDILAAHHLLILPSYDENFGNVVIESLSVGTAVLISSQVGLADYVQQNGLGYICQTSAASVATHINSLSPAQLESIRAKAPALIYHDFNETNLITLYKNMYQLCIS